MRSNSTYHEYKRQLQDRGILPSHEQELLLKAGLLDGDEAIMNWKKWQEAIDIDLIDRESNRMLPLLYSKLNQLGVEEEILGRYKGVYRKNWYKNQLLIEELKSLVAMFREAGIDTMVLKGAAMVVKYYDNLGQRPMADVDVLVPKERIADAIALLSSKGWKSMMQISYEKKDPQFFKRRPIRKEFFSIRASSGFRNELQREFDLHSHVLSDGMDSKLDTEFWQNSERIEFGNGLHSHVPSPSDLLLHAVVHGLRPGRSVNLRWIADAKFIIDKSEVDWDRLVSLANANGLHTQLAFGLNYLVELIGIKIPASVLSELSSDRISYRMDAERDSKLEKLSYLWTRNHAQHRQKMFIERLIAFPKLIQEYYLLQHFWHVPIFLVYKGLKRKVG